MGFIHDKLDIKLLILYLASRLSGPVAFDTFADLALCDEGVNYFQLAEAASELMHTGHLTETDSGMISITAKGRQDIAEGADSLSRVIRRRCETRAAPVNEALLRAKQARASVEPAPDGAHRLHLRFSEGDEELMSLSLWTPDETFARRAAQRFQDDPARVYNGVLRILMDDHKEVDGT